MGMHCYLLPVCIKNSNSDIVMMQSAENRVGVHTASSLNRARKRRILTQRTMRSSHNIIGGVGVQNSRASALRLPRRYGRAVGFAVTATQTRRLRANRNNKAIEQLKADGWGNEQIRGRDVRRVVA